MSPSSPQVVADRYRLVSPLGQGGMGRVWRATDEVLHRDVAIKELVPPPGLTADERREMRERSLREARAIALLNNINIVRVFDVLRTDADPWIVMEYVASRSLQDVLAQDGPLPATRAAEIGLGVLNALRAAHRAGVVHRDVKPGNVLLGEGGRVVLTDFGLAIIPGDPNVTRTGLVLGSPAYIAPERARDGTAGPEADLWSLGATLYAAVEGQSPYARPSAIATLAALATEAPPPAKNAGLLKPVLAGLLRKNPAERIRPAEAERLLQRAAGRKARVGLAMSPTQRRPGIGRGRDVPPPVVPGPREPISATSRSIFTPGRASVPPASGRIDPAGTAREALPPVEPPSPGEPAPTAESTPPAEPPPSVELPIRALGESADHSDPVTKIDTLDPELRAATATESAPDRSAAKPPAGPPVIVVDGVAASKPAVARPIPRSKKRKSKAARMAARGATAAGTATRPNEPNAATTAPPATGEKTTSEKATTGKVTSEKVTTGKGAGLAATAAKPTPASPARSNSGTSGKGTSGKGTSGKGASGRDAAGAQRARQRNAAQAARIRAAKADTAVPQQNGGSAGAALRAAARARVGLANGAGSSSTGGGTAGVLAKVRERPRPWLTVALAAAVLVILAVVIPLASGGDDPTAAPAGAAGASAAATPDPSTGAAPRKAAPPASSPSAALPSGGAVAALPRGWRMYTDSRFGYSVPVPAGWRISREGSRVEFREQKPPFRLLIVDQTRTPKSDPLTDWQTQERSRRGTYSSYQLIGIDRVDYWDSAADWDFRYTSDSGNRLRVRNRNFITAKDQAYSLYWSTSDDRWGEDLDSFDLIAARFVPARR